jgi:hypothetical protein
MSLRRVLLEGTPEVYSLYWYKSTNTDASIRQSNGSCSRAESLGSQEELAGEESGAGARPEESWQEGEDNVTGGGEGEEDGATALRKFLARGTPWPFKKTYPPPSVISGIKASEGRVLIQGYLLY